MLYLFLTMQCFVYSPQCNVLFIPHNALFCLFSTLQFFVYFSHCIVLFISHNEMFCLFPTMQNVLFFPHGNACQCCPVPSCLLACGVSTIPVLTDTRSSPTQSSQVT